MAQPLLLTKQALPLLESALTSNHRQLSRLVRQHRGTANSLTPVTDALIANNRRLVEIGRNSAEVLNQAVQILSKNEAFSREIRHIMDNVTSVATAVEEMAATATEISRTAQQAAKRAEESNAKAATGNENISSLVGDMDQLEAAIKSMADGMHQFVGFSREINKLTAIVRDIAHQTNLLALNAAIEAARAGEAGRGFAVVADEVKKLADKTAQATTEIESVTNTMNALSEQVATSVNTSLDRLGKSISALDTVASVLADGNNVVRDVSDRVHQIAVAAEEQSAVSGEMANNLAAVTTALNNENHQVTAVSQHARDLTDVAGRQADLLAAFGQDEVMLQAAKADHLLCKARLYGTVLSESTTTEQEAGELGTGRLERWRQNNEARYGQLPAFRALSEPLGRLQDMGKDILQRSSSGDFKKALATLQETDAVSRKFFEAIDQLTHDVREG
ncbi:MAG: methyl-accepting chemotaxis protein [Gammaproteobacteria bacterium]|nr:methyl-accepting chemotaxis protein [Gammaproteobacteria bacterium]